MAEVAGGDWPQRAAAAWAKLASRDDPDAHGVGAMLLADIRQVFGDATCDRIFSKALVESLCRLADRPWPEVNRGRLISETWLARRLHSFGVNPKTLRIGNDRAKGYELDDFNEPFERYLPVRGKSKRDSVTNQAGVEEIDFARRDTPKSCHASETHETPANTALSRCHALKEGVGPDEAEQEELRL